MLPAARLPAEVLTVKSPCLSCVNADNDKNGAACLACRDRVDYVRSFGGHYPGDIERSDNLANGIRWQETELDIIREDHAAGATDAEIAAKLGRTAAAVQRQRSLHAIKKDGREKQNRPAPSFQATACVRPGPLPKDTGGGVACTITLRLPIEAVLRLLRDYGEGAAP